MVFVCCKTRTTSTTEAFKFPELIIRPHVIGPEEEMGFVLEAYNKLTNKIAAHPDDFESRLSLAELFMQEARISGEHGYYYPAAFNIVEEVLQNQPTQPLQYRALLDKASILLSQHQFAAAKDAGLKALAINEYSADAYGVMVDAYVELGMYDKAVEMADKMVSIRPDIRSYSRVSYLREIHGEVESAIEAMKLAVAAGYPGMEQTEWARLTLGNLYEHYGSPDSAMIQYEMALSARPNYPFAISALSNVYASSGNIHLADSLNSVAAHLIPEVVFFINRAKWEKERGNHSKCEELTREILAMIADDEKSGHLMSLELANVYLELLSDPESALQHAMKEYDLRPGNIDVNRMLAQIYFRQGNYAKANVHLEKALRTGSKHPDAKCLEGLLLTKSGMKQEGEKLLKQLFAQMPYLECSLCKEARSIAI